MLQEDMNKAEGAKNKDFNFEYCLQSGKELNISKASKAKI